MWPLVATLIGGFVGMGIWRKQQKKKTTPKEPANGAPFQNVDKQDVFSEKHRATTSIYSDEAIVQLAERCKEGDVSSMGQMASFLRSRCTPPLIELMNRYEADPVQENEIAIQNYLRSNSHEKRTAEGYMMWLVRAALYGDAEVSTQLEQWPFYRQFAYIPYDMMTGKGSHSFSLWASSFLYEIGFIDVPDDYEDCRLSYNVDERYFDLRYVSFYIPPDEDGFGAEWEYDDIYFDEFFRRLPAKPQGAQKSK